MDQTCSATRAWISVHVTAVALRYYLHLPILSHKIRCSNVDRFIYLFLLEWLLTPLGFRIVIQTLKRYPHLFRDRNNPIKNFNLARPPQADRGRKPTVVFSGLLLFLTASFDCLPPLNCLLPASSSSVVPHLSSVSCFMALHGLSPFYGIFKSPYYALHS